MPELKNNIKILSNPETKEVINTFWKTEEQVETLDQKKARILQRTMHTLKMLMKLLVIDFHYQKVSKMYEDKK